MIYDSNGAELVTVKDANGSGLSVAYDSAGNTIFEEGDTPQRNFRVMSYNVQGFTGLNEQVDILHEAFSTQEADIVGMQEYQNAGNKYIDGLPVSRYLKTFGYDYYRVGTLATNKTFLASKYPTSDLTEHVYTDIVSQSDIRSYIKCHINIGGKTIAFYNTHLDNGDVSYRESQMAELMADMDTEDSVVMVGDFNVLCFSADDADYIRVIKPLIDAGYYVANCNPYRDGFIPTYTGGTDFTQGYYCLDNIVTSPDISIINVWTDSYKVNHNPDGLIIDHIPIIADLAFDT